MRAEEAYQDWASAPPSERPLAAARTQTASALYAVLTAHGVSRSRFADMIGVTEKTVCQYLDGAKPIPTAVVLVMPTDMANDFAQRLLDVRAGGARSAKRAVGALRSAIARIEPGTASDSERRELLREVVQAQARLNDLMRWLTEDPRE